MGEEVGKKVKKEVKNQVGKEVKKEVSKVDFYLTIINLLKEGKNLTKISEYLNISKQKLNYYISDLKKTNIIKKLGYGVWEFNEKEFGEVKILLEKLSQVARFHRQKIQEIPNFNIEKIRKVLREKELYECILCGNKLVELHHLKERKNGGMDSVDNIIPLCRNHHEYVHKIGLNDEIRKKIIKFHNIVLSLVVDNKIRGHAFMFKFKIPRIKNWNFERRKKFLDDRNINYKRIDLGKGGQRIKIKGCNVWLLNSSVIVYTKESFIEASAKKSKERAIGFLLEIIAEVEDIFKVNLKINNTYKFKICRQHYSRLKDILAIQCNKEGKKINVYNEKGLWFVVDNSYNLHESETVHPETSEKDLDKVISPFLNDLKKNPTTFSQVLEVVKQNALQIGGVTENQVVFDMNMKSHIGAIKELGKGVRKLTKVVGKIKEENKRLKLGTQTTLTDFI